MTRHSFPSLPLLSRGLLLAAILFGVDVLLQIGVGALVARSSAGLRRLLDPAIWLVAAGLMIVVYRGLLRPLACLPAGGAEPSRLFAFHNGLLLGAGLMLAAETIMVLGGGALITGFAHPAAVPGMFAGAVFAAVAEELTFRGVLLRVLDRAVGRWPALLCSAGLFGGLHALNSGATVIGVVAVAIEAGLLLGLAYLWARTLWFPIGLHLGWNFLEGGIFSAGVSGTGTGQNGLFAVIYFGPPFLTGGTFGPEASLQAVVLCLAASAVLFLAIRQRDTARRPVAAV